MPVGESRDPRRVRSAVHVGSRARLGACSDPSAPSSRLASRSSSSQLPTAPRRSARTRTLWPVIGCVPHGSSLHDTCTFSHVHTPQLLSTTCTLRPLAAPMLTALDPRIAQHIAHLVAHMLVVGRRRDSATALRAATRADLWAQSVAHGLWDNPRRRWRRCGGWWGSTEFATAAVRKPATLLGLRTLVCATPRFARQLDVVTKLAL